MKRPWMMVTSVWLVLAAVAAGLLWLTCMTINADRHRAEIVASARHEQQLSLALWRMDTLLAPIIAREAARPWWTLMSDWEDAGRGGQPRLPGLRQAPEYVKYHFHWPLDSVPWSPQAGRSMGGQRDRAATDSVDQNLNGPTSDPNQISPTAVTVDQRQIAQQLDQLRKLVDPTWLLNRLPEETFPSLSPWLASAAASELANNWSPRNAMLNRSYFGGYGGVAGNSPIGNRPNDPAGSHQTGRKQAVSSPRQKGGGAAAKEELSADSPQPDEDASSEGRQQDNDIESRNLRYQVQAAQAYLQQREANSVDLDPFMPEVGTSDVAEGISQAVWVADRLLLARRVTMGKTVAIQGCELDWPRLKQELLAEARGLLRGADLVAVDPSALPTPSHLLAGLPVRLEAVLPSGTGEQWTPIQTAWLIGWIAFALAALGMVSLFHGLVALSEKRASFVSAVTHELRTPLTTFRLYSQMLARDMVPLDARQQYLTSLCAEAERLSHLIDNVLTYARLERGRSRLDIRPIAVSEMLERIASRLIQRAEQARMQFAFELDPAVGERRVVTDLAAVEQILFNLVDNASKYAAAAVDQRIQSHVNTHGNWLVITVIDHGPGLSADAERKLFQPFSKSTEQAAGSAPGVGLGLALCRRLARQIGGRLGPVPPDEGDLAGSAGCRMELRLPLAGDAPN